jgi:lipoprotein NlpI
MECIACFALLLTLSSACPSQDTAKDKTAPVSEASWYERVEKALKEGKADDALSEMDAVIKRFPENSQLMSIRGSLKFRSGKIAASIQDFDKCIELSPETKPYLWQRGIALYYAERFKDGLDQFAVHREVNPNDVENAFWHFLCNVRLNGLEASQKDVLLAGFDSRVPLMQVQKLIQGKLTPDDVLSACEKGGAGAEGKKSSRFYGYLYLGLYYDALQDTDKTKLWLEKCLEQDVDGYMADVAKVHLNLLKAKK